MTVPLVPKKRNDKKERCYFMHIALPCITAVTSRGMKIVQLLSLIFLASLLTGVLVDLGLLFIAGDFGHSRGWCIRMQTVLQIKRRRSPCRFGVTDLGQRWFLCDCAIYFLLVRPSWLIMCIFDFMECCFIYVARIHFCNFTTYNPQIAESIDAWLQTALARRRLT